MESRSRLPFLSSLALDFPCNWDLMINNNDNSNDKPRNENMIAWLHLLLQRAYYSNTELESVRKMEIILYSQRYLCVSLSTNFKSRVYFPFLLKCCFSISFLIFLYYKTKGKMHTRVCTHTNHCDVSPKTLYKAAGEGALSSLWTTWQ